MNVLNVHERKLAAAPEAVGALLDQVGLPDDPLWPKARWPAMRFDSPRAVGAQGGHGPIRYRVEAHEPGRSIRFRFTAPRGFDGFHALEVLPAPDARTCVLRHTLGMRAHGFARLTWPLLYRPLHDALIEDSFTTAEGALRLSQQVVPWSPYVRFLRWLLSRKARGGTIDRIRR